MELEKLKESWQVHHRDKEPEFVLVKSNVEAILKQKAEAQNRKIIRLMSVDAVFMVLVNAGFIGLLYALDFNSKHMSALIICGFALFLFVHYHFHLMKLRISVDNYSLRTSVSKNLRTMKRYFLFYQVSLPSALSILTYLFLPSITMAIDKSFAFSSAESIVVSGAVGAIAFLTIYLVVRLLYSGHIRELRQIGKDLQN